MIMDEKVQLCQWCHQPCDRLVVDPYQQDVNGVTEIVPLHEECEQELAMEI